MRIVMIEDFFHPDAGYQCNLLSRYLTDFGHEVVMVSSEMEKIPDELKRFFGSEDLAEKDRAFTERFGVRIVRVPILKYISGRSIYRESIFRLIDELRPDLLFVHGNDTYLGLRYCLRQSRLRYPMLTDNHMLEIAAKNRFSRYFGRFYRLCVTPRLIRNRTTVIRTVESDYVWEHYGIPLSQAPVVGFGSDVKLFHPDAEAKKRVREELGLAQDAFVCAYAGKLDETKGGVFFAEAIREKLTAEKEIQFLVVGNTVGDYGERTEAAFAASENRVLRLPTQRYAELPRIFQAADIALYPKQCSLSFYDSTACGAPALVEDNEIGLQRSRETGCLCFRAGDREDFREKIRLYADMPETERAAIRESGLAYILSSYNYETQAREYERIILQTAADFGKRA